MFGKKEKEVGGGHEAGRAGSWGRLTHYRWFHRWRHRSPDLSPSRWWVWFCACPRLEIEKSRTEISTFHTTRLLNISQQLHPVNNCANGDVSSLEENWLHWAPTRRGPRSRVLHAEGDFGICRPIHWLKPQTPRVIKKLLYIFKDIYNYHGYGFLKDPYLRYIHGNVYRKMVYLGFTSSESTGW